MQISLVLSAFDRNFVLTLGADVQPDESEGKEIVVIESSADTQIARQIGFTVNPDDEEDDDE